MPIDAHICIVLYVEVFVNNSLAVSIISIHSPLIITRKFTGFFCVVFFFFFFFFVCVFFPYIVVIFFVFSILFYKGHKITSFFSNDAPLHITTHFVRE